MADPVELTVRNGLQKVIDELEKIKGKAQETGDSFKQVGAGVTEGLNRNVKQTENFFSQLTSLGRRVADQLRGDFKALVSINALTDALKLSNQLKNSVAQTVELSDSVRKLGRTFGIAGSDFASFQAKMSEGLGELGMDADVASKALDGLSKTPVRGQENLLQYSQAAGMLASIGRERGREGEISGGMANVIRSSGGNPNDPAQMARLAETLRKVFVQTGAAPTETLGKMQELFDSMTESTRKQTTPEGLAKLAVISQQAGPQATRFLESFLGKTNIEKLPFNAQGGGKVFSDKGLNVDEFQKFYKSITSRIGFDPETAAKTLGLTDEEAKGFVRLGAAMEQVSDAQSRIDQTTGSLNEEYRASMGLGESFRASINKVKGELAKPFANVTQGATSALSSASQTTLGSAAVVGAGALTAAALTGLAMKGISGALGGGIVGKTAGVALGAARTEAAGDLFGTKVIPVYVTNVDEIGAGGAGGLGAIAEGAAGAGAAAGGGLSLLAGLLGIPIAAYAAHQQFQQGTEEINAASVESRTKRTAEGMSEGQISVLRKAFESGKIPEARREQTKAILQDYDVHRKASGIMGTGPTQNIKVIVDTKNPNLKTTVERPPRGASF